MSFGGFAAQKYVENLVAKSPKRLSPSRVMWKGQAVPLLTISQFKSLDMVTKIWDYRTKRELNKAALALEGKLEETIAGTLLTPYAQISPVEVLDTSREDEYSAEIELNTEAEDSK